LNLIPRPKEEEKVSPSKKKKSTLKKIDKVSSTQEQTIILSPENAFDPENSCIFTVNTVMSPISSATR